MRPFSIMKSISEKKPAVSDEYSPFATYIDNKLKSAFLLSKL